MFETIQHAAVKFSDGVTCKGKSHACCFHQRPKNDNTRAIQGFLTSEGRFVTRDEGAKIASAAGQLHKATDFLFSEDFWSDMYRGKYDYDPEMGYVLKTAPNTPDTKEEG